MAKWDILFGVILTGLGMAMIFTARGFPAITGLSVGPSLFPTLIGAGMVLVGSVIAINTWRIRPRPPATDRALRSAPFLTWNLALISGLILAFLILMNVTGFSIACFTSILGLLRIYHRKWLLTDLILMAISILTVFIIFSFVFRVSLPVGPVEKLIFKVMG